MTQNYVDRIANHIDNKWTEPAGIAPGVKLFTTPNDSTFYFFVLPHADTVAGGNYDGELPVRKAEVYVDLLGQRSLMFAPGGFGLPDALDYYLDQSTGIKFQKDEFLTLQQRELRKRMRTHSKILMYILTTDNPEPQLWIMGQQTFVDKIFNAMKSPLLRQANIVFNNPYAGMWFEGRTTGSGRAKRIGSAQIMSGTALPLHNDKAFVDSVLKKLIPLEHTLMVPSYDDTIKYRDQILAAMAHFQGDLGNGQPVGQPISGMVPTAAIPNSTPEMPATASHTGNVTYPPGVSGNIAAAASGTPSLNNSLPQPAAAPSFNQGAVVNSVPQPSMPSPLGGFQASTAPTPQAVNSGPPLPPSAGNQAPVPMQPTAPTFNAPPQFAVPTPVQPAAPITPPMPQEGQQGIAAPVMPSFDVKNNAMAPSPGTGMPDFGQPMTSADLERVATIGMGRP